MGQRALRAPSALRRNGSVQFTEHCTSRFPQKPTASPYGVVAHVLAGGIQYGNPTTDTTYGTINTLLGQANVGWVRVDFDWGRLIGSSLDTNNLSWGGIDAAVNRAVCGGMNILGTLAYTPAVASTRSVPVDSMRFTYMPDSLRYWAAFVRAAVNRYPQIRYWSIWNEPNSTSWFRGYAGELDVVPAYEALLDSAAPGIRQNVDAQGRRFLVAPELAGGLNDGSDQWLRRVLVDRGPLIDVVAVHEYGATTGAGVQQYVAQLPSRVNLPFQWPWDIWLTEVSVTGCNATPYGAARAQLTYCTGTNLSYIADDFLSSFTVGVFQAMQTPGSSPWAKTFTYDASSEVVSDSVGESYGLLGGARANSVFGRPAFTAYAGVAGPLGVSGAATYASGQNVPVTAAPAVPSSYYFVWEYQWCYNGNAPGDCDHQWHPYTAGTGVVSISPYVYRQDYYVYTRVRQYAWQNGPQIGSGEWDITGDGTCTDPRGCGSGGGGGMYATPTDTLKAHDAAAHDPTAERLKGIGHARNK